MKITLESIDPFQPAFHLTLDHWPILIGRNGDSQIHLPDRWVSSRHCEITTEDGAVMVRDLKSKYGTLINGRSVKCSELHSGDRLTVGIRTFSVSYRAAVRGGTAVVAERAEPVCS